jgi:hypothetical protein
MARHINNTETMAAGQVEKSKTEFNGDAPLLFFLETVGLNAGEGPDQTGLAMVHMAGSTKDNLPHLQAPVMKGLARFSSPMVDLEPP